MTTSKEVTSQCQPDPEKPMWYYSCDFCDGPAVAVSTAGPADSRRLRCSLHRVLGGEYGDAQGAGRRENDWARDPALSLDVDVIARVGTGRGEQLKVRP
jgi:hypothetical protein